MKKFLAIFLCIMMVAVLFVGCQNQQARRTVPNYPVNYKNDSNNRGNNLLPNNTNQGAPGLSGGDYGQSVNPGTNQYGNMPGNTNLGTGMEGGVGRFGATGNTGNTGGTNGLYGGMSGLGGGGIGGTNGTGMGTGNNVGIGMNGGLLSAEFTKSDVGYCKTTASAPIKTGCGNNYSTIATVPKGQQLKVLGDLGDWFVVQVPNSNRVGAVPKAQATPYSSTTNPNPPQVPATGGTAMTGDETRILQLCNAERAKVGAKALKSNMEVTKLARLKSEDMVNKNYFDHTSPTYGSPFDMMKKYGVSYMYAGENIAMNQNADKAFQAWMNSPGHKKNILNPSFTELGVGIANKGGGSYIYTQMFIGK